MDHQVKHWQRDQDRDNIGYHRIIAEEGCSQSACPLSGCTEQISGEHGNDGNVKITVEHKMDQQDQRKVDQKRITPIKPVHS